MREEPVEEQHVGSRADGEMQVAVGRGGGASGLDDDDFRASYASGGKQPLMQDRMTPGEVGAGQHDQVGKLQILVDAGNDVFAEGALVARNGRGHAEPRIRVDIDRTYKTLHQLVGDVIVLRLQLPWNVEGDPITSVLPDRRAKF